MRSLRVILKTGLAVRVLFPEILLKERRRLANVMVEPDKPGCLGDMALRQVGRKRNRPDGLDATLPDLLQMLAQRSAGMRPDFLRGERWYLRSPIRARPGILLRCFRRQLQTKLPGTR